MDSNEIVRKVVATKRRWRGRKQTRMSYKIIIVRLAENGAILLNMESLPYHTTLEDIHVKFDFWDPDKCKQTDFLLYCIGQRLDWIMKYGVSEDQLEATDIIKKLGSLRQEDHTAEESEGGLVFKAIDPMQSDIESTYSHATWTPLCSNDRVKEMREYVHRRNIPIVARKVRAYGIYFRAKALIEKHESRNPDGELTEEQLAVVDALLSGRSETEKHRENALAEVLTTHAPFRESETEKVVESAKEREAH